MRAVAWVVPELFGCLEKSRGSIRVASIISPMRLQGMIWRKASRVRNVAVILARKTSLEAITKSSN